jgi:Major capsid protein N-terminus/Large eukaryotic DNA virus major capsid protein
MSGALVELAAKGVQDAYLSGKPEVSFFQQNYKRHTNFAQKPVKLDTIGSFTPNSTISIKIPNKGDLLGYVWMDMKPFGANITGSTKIDALIGNGANSKTGTPTMFELYIGGQLIDRQDAFYTLQLWQKFLADSSAKGYSYNVPASGTSPVAGTLDTTWAPLHFFFCDSCYLPLVALQYHEVEIRVTFGSDYVTPSVDPTFYANYVVLDTEEREFFVKNDQDLLIEQVQRIPIETGNSKFDLSFLNHPIKCVMWGDANAEHAFTTQYVQIYLNGTELFGSPMPDKYFSDVQSYYHSDFASYLQGGQSPSTQYVGGNLKMYSFALKANKHQPCGTCNFSRLDNAAMTFTASTDIPLFFFLYAVNFNVLRIKKGLAGVAFSN